ncbi:hypothetical protein LTR33_012600 [Friedmanniomyces endolithicus]|nr:hypothetical protein LTR33_012600 [Friedmanniomyces endolithicus]
MQHISDICSKTVAATSPPATPKSAARVPCLSSTRNSVNRVHKTSPSARLDTRTTSSIPHSPSKPTSPKAPRPRALQSSKRLQSHPDPTNPTTLEDSSSDEWTGDEDFLPRSARRRHRQQRLRAKAAEQQQRSPLCRTPSPPRPFTQPPPSPIDSPLSVTFRERLAALRSPGASRFQRRVVVVVREAGTSGQMSTELVGGRGPAGSVGVGEGGAAMQSAFSSSSEGGSEGEEEEGCGSL